MANRIRPSVSPSSVRQTSFRWSLDREVAPSQAENADPNGTWQPKFSKDTRGPIASSPVLSEDATWQLAPQVECRLALSSDVPVGSARGECEDFSPHPSQRHCRCQNRRSATTCQEAGYDERSGKSEMEEPMKYDLLLTGGDVLDPRCWTARGHGYWHCRRQDRRDRRLVASK